MKTRLTFILLLLAGILVWALLVIACAHFYPIPSPRRNFVLEILFFGVPGIFTIAMGVIGFTKKKSEKLHIRLLVGTLWASGFVVACWFSGFYIIVPAYFYFGGGE
jgi:hypothetical protein